MNKKKIKLTIFVILILFIGYYLFFLVTPLIVVGPPSSVYSITNYDSMPHNISVLIFDENNKSVLQNTYVIRPEQNVDFDRQINWHIPIMSEQITWSHGTYPFQFILDNNISKNITIPIWPWQTIGVWLYYQGYYDNEPIPIDIKVSTV